jgi:hypothetical protein
MRGRWLQKTTVLGKKSPIIDFVGHGLSFFFRADGKVENALALRDV